MEPLRMMTHDETSDLHAAREGDLEAFERLYRANVGRVYALCLRLTGSRSAAEERTQDTFVTAWEKLSGFRQESAFSTWLHRLAVNTVLMESRTRERRLRRVVPVEDLERAQAPAASGTDSVIDLDHALKTLPEGARKVFVLHDIHGYGHAEIAEMAGVTAGTSKAQLHRARKLLREVLQ